MRWGGCRPAGHFFGDPHTLERYATAFYQPLSPTGRTTRAGRRRAGSTPRARATAVWKKALEDYVEPPLEPDVREALEAYVARRKEEIGADEP